MLNCLLAKIQTSGNWNDVQKGCTNCTSKCTRPLIHRWWFVKQRIDGVDIRSLDVQWVRAQLALVSQEPVLFNTTIFDNIAYGDNTRTPTMDEVIDVAKKANIHNFIASLPLVRSCVVTVRDEWTLSWQMRSGDSLNISALVIYIHVLVFIILLAINKYKYTYKINIIHAFCSKTNHLHMHLFPISSR